MSAEWEGDKAWLDKMRRLEGAADLRRVDTELHRAVTDLTRRNFAGQRGPAGAWPRRKARRSAEPVTHPLLQKSGSLRRSVTERDSEGSVWEVTRDSVVYGSTLPQAVHQRGVPRRNIPPRPFMPTSEQFARAVAGVLRLSLKAD